MAFTREDDDLVLEWLRMRRQGIGPRVIAAEFNVPWSKVNNWTVNIQEADMKQSGEPEGAVKGGYW